MKIYSVYTDFSGKVFTGESEAKVTPSYYILPERIQAFGFNQRIQRSPKYDSPEMAKKAFIEWQERRIAEAQATIRNAENLIQEASRP
jgi:hypothetical protein